MKRILMFQDYYSSGGIEKIINDLKTNPHTSIYKILDAINEFKN